MIHGGGFFSKSSAHLEMLDGLYRESSFQSLNIIRGTEDIHFLESISFAYF